MDEELRNLDFSNAPSVNDYIRSVHDHFNGTVSPIDEITKMVANERGKAFEDGVQAGVASEQARLRAEVEKLRGKNRYVGYVARDAYEAALQAVISLLPSKKE